MGRTSGLVQAEGQRITSPANDDLITIYKRDTNSGQYEPRDITFEDLIAAITDAINQENV